MTFQFRAHPLLRQALKDKIFWAAVQNAFNHVVITDPEAVILYANQAVERITGYSQQEVIGKTPRLWGGLMDEEFYRRLWKTIKEDKQVFEGEITNRRKNGEQYRAKVIVTPILDDNDELLGYIGTEEDISAQENAIQKSTESISIAAHQLKTPLSVIDWSLDSLEEECGQHNSTTKEHFTNAREALARLQKLVDSLLNVSRIEAGRLAVNPIPVEICVLLHEVTANFGPMLTAKEQRIVEECQDPPPTNFDPALVREIWTNLITNASRYSPEGSEIRVKIAFDDNTITCAVTDHGIGIPEDEQSKIFSKFYRASNALSFQTEGTGLGLYFAKQLVTLLGGTIWLGSRENEGTTFFFTLPRAGVGPKPGEATLA